MKKNSLTILAALFCVAVSVYKNNVSSTIDIFHMKCKEFFRTHHFEIYRDDTFLSCVCARKNTKISKKSNNFFSRKVCFYSSAKDDIISTI